VVLERHKDIYKKGNVRCFRQKKVCFATFLGKYRRKICDNMLRFWGIRSFDGAERGRAE
jgi:hypothetical protein